MKNSPGAQQRWQKAHPQLVKEIKRKYRLAHPERVRAARHRQYLIEDRDWTMVRDQLRRYGLTLDQFHSRLESQNFCCAICETELTHGHRDGLTVDHCHTFNHVRGFLCGLCNRGLGQFLDNRERLVSALAYLDRTAA